MKNSYNTSLMSRVDLGLISTGLSVRAYQLILFFSLHILLAVGMRNSSNLATVHALITLGVGVWVALFDRDQLKAGYVAAYIVGAELLWRMTGAQIFWEAGKYFIVIILGLAFLRKRSGQGVLPPLLYFLLLLASIPLTLAGLGVTSTAQEAISFNLSGPLALTVTSLYFRQVKFDNEKMQRLVWCLVVPIIGIATLVLYGIFTSSGSIVFTTESNFATSGGFGPNQVSALLGLGAGLLLLLFMTGDKALPGVILLFLALGLAALSALTFSRGGLYNLAVMTFLPFLYLVWKSDRRIPVLAGLIVLGLLAAYLVFPRLDAFTGGLLTQRFADTNTTLRGVIAQADLDLWKSNPLLGVGPGMSKYARLDLFGFMDAAHTEYTRILAEHGLVGAVAMAILLFALFRIYWQSPDVHNRIWMIGLVAWGLMEMTHAAMRIMAISFLLGLAMVGWEKENRK